MCIENFRKELEASRIEPGILSACLALTDILAKIRPGDGAHLGLNFFYERLQSAADRERLLPALSILCARENTPLEMNGYLDDPDLGQVHLSDEEFLHLIATGELAHPVSGELVQDPFGQVHIYYSLRSEDCRGD